MIECRQADDDARSRFQLRCAEALVARRDFAALEELLTHTETRCPPASAALRWCVLQHASRAGLRSSAAAQRTRKCMERVLRAEPDVEQFWQIAIDFETAVGDAKRASELRWRMRAALDN